MILRRFAEKSPLHYAYYIGTSQHPLGRRSIRNKVGDARDIVEPSLYRGKAPEIPLNSSDSDAAYPTHRG